MNKRRYLVIVFFTLFASVIYATPDRYRLVIDNFIGLNGKNIIVYQYIEDDYGKLQEEYLIEKYMENGDTKIIKQIKIEKNNNIENLLLREYKGKIKRVIPSISYYYNNIQTSDHEYLTMGYTIYELENHIPKELKDCTIMRIVDIYFEGDYYYLTVDLTDYVNNYRKVIMIKRKE